MAAQVDAAFAVINVNDLANTLPRFKLAIAAIVRQFGQASASLAATFYRDERRLANKFGPFTMHIADPAGLREVDANMSWATRTLWSPDADVHLPQVFTQVLGASEKLVLDTGRDTTAGTADRDPHARGWVRETKDHPCAFCALLATRGVIKGSTTYRSRQSAGPNRSSKTGREFVGEGKFKVHDHCRCTAKPIFGPYEASAQIREWASLHASIPHANGSKAQRAAWRAAYHQAYGKPSTTQGETP